MSTLVDPPDFKEDNSNKKDYSVAQKRQLKFIKGDESLPLKSDEAAVLAYCNSCHEGTELGNYEKVEPFIHKHKGHKTWITYLGRKIQNVYEVLKDLNKAHSDAWHAYYQYWITAQCVTGKEQEAVRSILEKHAKSKLKHAREIAKRIRTLGGTPVKSFYEADSGKALTPVRDMPGGTFSSQLEPTDTKNVVEAIQQRTNKLRKSYQKLVKKHREFRLVTHETLEDILRDETKFEKKWLKLAAKIV